VRQRIELRRELLARCEAIRHVDSLQPPFIAMIDRRRRRRRFLCAAMILGVIWLQPHQPDADERSRRSSMASTGRGRLAAPRDRVPTTVVGRNLALRDALKPSANGTKLRVMQLPLPGPSRGLVERSIVGASTPKSGRLERSAAIKITRRDLRRDRGAMETAKGHRGRDRITRPRVLRRDVA